jgi:hypothetical protein
MNTKINLSLAVTVLCTFIFTGFAAEQTNMNPEAAVIIEQCRQSFSWMESVSMKIDTKTIPTGLSDKGPSGSSMVFRYDHGRAEWRGTTFLYDKAGNVDPNVNLKVGAVFSENRYISYDTPVNQPLTRAFVSSKANEHLQAALEDTSNGSPLWGRIYGCDKKNIADLLAESSEVAMSREIIGDVNCFVIQGVSIYGKVTAWIAPQKGYSTLKWSIERRKGVDTLNGKLSTMDCWEEVFENVETREISGRFVPVKGTYTKTMVPNKEFGRVVIRKDYAVGEVQLNPDFKSMGAFKADLTNGLKVYVEEAPGILYKWKDDVVVADADGPTFEEIDKMMEKVKAGN